MSPFGVTNTGHSLGASIVFRNPPLPAGFSQGWSLLSPRGARVSPLSPKRAEVHWGAEHP